MPLTRVISTSFRAPTSDRTCAPRVQPGMSTRSWEITTMNCSVIRQVKRVCISLLSRIEDRGGNTTRPGSFWAPWEGPEVVGHFPRELTHYPAGRSEAVRLLPARHRRSRELQPAVPGPAAGGFDGHDRPDQPLALPQVHLQRVRGCRSRLLVQVELEQPRGLLAARRPGKGHVVEIGRAHV